MAVGDVIPDETIRFVTVMPLQFMLNRFVFRLPMRFAAGIAVGTQGLDYLFYVLRPYL
jgi:hypothetical protein